MKGQIIKSTGSWYVVRDEAHKVHKARLRGKFKINKIKVTNPLAVGDWVEFELQDEGEQVYSITKILDRHNYVIRKATKLSAQAQIIASNIDQAILIATVKSPHTSLGFIDRFLVTTESFRIPVTIIFNKTDILNDKELKKLDERCAIYEELGYNCLKVSIEENTGLEEIKELLFDKTTLVSGHSGVGKSSFVNYLFPDLDLETKKISKFNDKGKHTTTFAEMYFLPLSGKIIDTPGIKEIGIVDMEKEEIGHYFVEIRNRIGQCKFNNCLHVNEPQCAVKEAVENGDIAPNRYNTYLSLLQDC
ncbi:ribosome small subunit-dependent GTPase A [Cyclobacteriaceae bacterium]|nr:ribosome small subunit-dependent GTPase A [Cyclobacteriaceae bacterium]